MRVVVYHANCTDGIMCAWQFNEMYKGDRNGHTGDLYDANELIMFAGQYSQGLAEELYKFFTSLFSQIKTRGFYTVDLSTLKKHEFIPGNELLKAAAVDMLSDVDLFLTDFSLSLEATAFLLVYCQSVTLLDHHASSLKALEPLRGHPKFDMSFSNTAMCGSKVVSAYLRQQFFLKGVPEYHENPLLDYVQDYDLWQHLRTETMDIGAAIYANDFSIVPRKSGSTGYDFPGLSEILNMSPGDLQVYGAFVMRHVRKQAAKYIAGDWLVIYMPDPGLYVPVVNCPTDLANIVANEIAKQAGAAITYMQLPDRYVYSVRSVGEVDCIAIAKTLSGGQGGGHKNSAGFSLPAESELPNATVEHPDGCYRRSLVKK